MVKRGCTTLALAGCLLAGAVGPSVAAAADSVSGDGAVNEFGVFKTKLVISASSGSNGENPSGRASGQALLGGPAFDSGDALFGVAPAVPMSFSGKVTCLSVKGNKAVVKYGFDESADPAFLKDGGIEVFITDNGVGRNDTVGFLPPQDAVTWQLTDPTRCDPLDFSPFQVRAGDFSVTDG